MTPEERTKLIDQLDRSFLALPRWAKIACKHGLAAPSHHPETGKEFESFREVLEAASEESLLVIKGDFEENDDLAPEEIPPEPEVNMPFSANVAREEWVMWKARILTHHKEEIGTHAIMEALRCAARKMEVNVNYPNPDPEKYILKVRKDEEWNTFVFFYEPLETEPETEEPS